MNIEQIYTGCLAQGAYFIESNGEAAVIDPLRETGPYLERAKEKDVTIKYILKHTFMLILSLDILILPQKLVLL